jgi:hypothetical protein
LKIRDEFIDAFGDRGIADFIASDMLTIHHLDTLGLSPAVARDTRSRLARRRLARSRSEVSHVR